MRAQGRCCELCLGLTVSSAFIRQACLRSREFKFVKADWLLVAAVQISLSGNLELGLRIMLRMLVGCMALCLSLLLAPYAWCGDYFLSTGIGSAQVDLKPALRLDAQESGEEELLELDRRWRYVHAQVEVDSTLLNSIVSNTFGADDYRLAVLRISAGHDIHLASRWSVGPELSLVWASLSAEQGRFLNPGPERRSRVADLSIGWGCRQKSSCPRAATSNCATAVQITNSVTCIQRAPRLSLLSRGRLGLCIPSVSHYHS